MDSQDSVNQLMSLYFAIRLIIAKVVGEDHLVIDGKIDQGQ